MSKGLIKIWHHNANCYTKRKINLVQYVTITHTKIAKLRDKFRDKIISKYSHTIVNASVILPFFFPQVDVKHVPLISQT